MSDSREKVALYQLNLQRKECGLHEQEWSNLTEVIQDAYLEWANQILSIVQEWGIEPCHEHYRGGGVISQRECPLCWQTLLEKK